MTTAEQQRDVATLQVAAAEQYKKEQLLRADADSTYRRTMMQADGALQQKLATYEHVNQVWADAFGKYQGQLVPTTVLGGTGGGATPNGAQTMIDLITAKTARDLGLNMATTGAPQ